MSAATAPAALLAALRERAADLPAERVDRVWFFAPRAVGATESALAVLSVCDAAEPLTRRSILTLQCVTTVVRGRAQHATVLVEQGSAPAERVEDVLRGVLRRLGDTPEDPHLEEVRGSAERWAALLEGSGAPG